MYEDCPRKFLWYRGWGSIDLGRGPGRGKKKPEKKSEHHAVMGIVLADMCEFFYNDEEYKNPRGLMQRLERKVRRSFDRQLRKKYIDWRVSPARDEMWEVIWEGTEGFIQTVKANKLLGPYARSEVELLGYINKWTPVGGRADIIIRRDDLGVMILDGKNSKSKGKYTDPDQLRWYALCYYLFYGKLPDRLGFVYFRYPAGKPILDDEGNQTLEREVGVDWVEFTREDIQGLAQRAVTARKLMDKEKFEATPKASMCRWCEFETVCEERQAQREANSLKRRASSLKTAEKFFGGSLGFTEMGFE
jgi:hypothetical protein